MISKAIEFAKAKHAGQFHYGNTDYFAHPEWIATFLEGCGFNQTIVIAAYLHDTIEDTDTTYDEIKEVFGKDVADLVMELTSDESNYLPPKDPNFHVVKAKYLADKMNQMSNEALTIKLLDRLHNVIRAKATKKNWRSGYGYQTEMILEVVKPRSEFHYNIIQFIKEELIEDD